MKSTRAHRKVSTPATVPQLDQRMAANGEPADCRLQYTYEANGVRYTAEAITSDLSRIGCGIRGSAILPVGSRTTLKFYVGEKQRPLSIDAKVTWVMGNCLGVTFPALSEKDYQRVRGALQIGGLGGV